MDGLKTAKLWCGSYRGDDLGFLGLNGRPADGLQSPHRAPMASCGELDCERILSGELSRTVAARVGRDAGSVACRPSDRDWNGSQLGHSATYTALLWPTLRKMQGEAVRRPDGPSHQSGDTSAEGLTGTLA